MLLVIDPSLFADLAVVLAAAIAAVPATLAWRSSNRNASQESVKELHDCLDAHTKQDELHFGELRKAAESGDAQREVFTATLKQIQDEQHRVRKTLKKAAK